MKNRQGDEENGKECISGAGYKETGKKNKKGCLNEEIPVGIAVVVLGDKR